MELEGQLSPSQLHRPENCQPRSWVLSLGASRMGSPVTRFCFTRGISIIPWRLEWWPGVSTAPEGQYCQAVWTCQGNRVWKSGKQKSRSTLGVWVWVHLEKTLLLYSSSGNWPVPSPGPPTWEVWSETGDTHLLPTRSTGSSNLWSGHVTLGSQSALRGVSRGPTPPRSWLSTETLLPPPGKYFLP